jgi:hypothetical protein
LLERLLFRKRKNPWFSGTFSTKITQPRYGAKYVIGPCHVSGIFLPLRVNSLPLATIYEVKIPLRKWKKSLLQRNPAQMTWHIAFLNHLLGPWALAHRLSGSLALGSWAHGIMAHGLMGSRAHDANPSLLAKMALKYITYIFGVKIEALCVVLDVFLYS